MTARFQDVMAALASSLVVLLIPTISSADSRFAALAPDGRLADEKTSVIYDATTGEIALDAPLGSAFTSINIDSAASIFVGQSAQNLGGSFDHFSDFNIFKATFGATFGSISFGNVARTGLSRDFLMRDLTVVGSLDMGGALGEVDLIHAPEPTSLVTLIIGCVALQTINYCARGSILGCVRLARK